MTSADDGQMADGSPGGVRLALYVQPPVAGGRVATVDRLTALAAEGAIQEYDITVVRGPVIVSEAGRGEASDELAAETATLAAWEQGELRSAFDASRSATRTGRQVRRLSLPEECLAVYAAGELVAVFPCTDGTTTWTAADFLDSYETSRQCPPELRSSLRLPTA
jgi:hypothetical protein